MCHIDPSQRVGTADPNAYRSWSLQSTRRRMGDRAGELLDPGPGANWQNGCQYREVSPRKNLAFPNRVSILSETLLVVGAGEMSRFFVRAHRTVRPSLSR